MSQKDLSQEGDTMSRSDDTKSGLDECNIITDLMGEKERFGDIGDSSRESNVCEELSLGKIDEKLREFQSVFRRSTVMSDYAFEASEALRKKAKAEAEEREKNAREEPQKATAFQFDFGHLDAEVHDLLHQLNSVYTNDTPMADTQTTKSLYSTSKSNIDKIGDISVILNRICFVGRLKEIRTSEREVMMDAEFTKIRERTDSIFAQELGAITGCLLRYPAHFMFLFEGPEISVMDIVLQAKAFCDAFVEEGKVLFVASQIMARYTNDWTTVSLNPRASAENVEDQDNEEPNAEEQLKLLGEQCVKFWKTVAYAKKNNLNPSKIMNSHVVPSEKQLSFGVHCSLLRDLHPWMNSLTELPFTDFTSSGRPQVFYPIQFTTFKTDSQFDSLGVMGFYENMPGLIPELEAFLRNELKRQPDKDDEKTFFKKLIS